jgi:trehalose-6-phosphate synthase
MHRGLSMDLAERQERWRALHAVVTRNTAQRFCAVFLSHMAREDKQSERPPLRAIS